MVNQINADSGIRRRSQTFRDLVLLIECFKTSHKPLFASHYLPLTESVVKMDGIEKVMGDLYSFARKTKRKVTRK
jgi:hypothetical protein